MTGQQLNYERIASAIRFIKENGRNISQTFSAIPERGICQTYPARDARIVVRHGV